MKRISVLAICFGVMLLSMSCDQEPQAADYSIAKNNQPLSDSDVTSCFGALGLRYERFKCMVPKRTGVTFSSKHYKAGEEMSGGSRGTTYVEKGLQDFILFMKADSSNISFSVASDGSVIGCGNATVADYQSRTHGWIPITKLSYDKQPVYVYAANNKGDIDGIKADTGDIETEIAKYDYAMVIYVSIKSPK